MNLQILSHDTTNHDEEIQSLHQQLEQSQELFWKRAGKKSRIVILGAGYAGLTCALGLRNLEAKIILINPNEYHYLTTLLHEPVVGRRDFEEVTVNLPSLLKDSNIQLVQGKASAIDLKAKTITVDQIKENQDISYDFLVVALGSEPEFYNIPGLEENAVTLGNWIEATSLQLRVEEQLLQHKKNPHETWHTHIVIGGAGLTGVELAGELVDWCKKISKKYGISPKNLRITLVDGSPTVLSACQPCQNRVIPLAEKTLKRKGVQIITGVHVKALEANRVVLNNDETLEAGLIIWTGGVRGHHLIEQSGLAVNRQKRALVNEYLQAQDHPEVFVIGDSAAAMTDEGALLPPTAQVAIHQGPMVASNFQRIFSCQPMESCAPKMMGVFLSIGQRDALGVVQNKYHFSGWIARFIKNAIAYRYLASLGGWKLVKTKLLKQDKPVKAKPQKTQKTKQPFVKRVVFSSVAGLLGTAAMTTLASIANSFGIIMDTPGMLSGFLQMPLAVGWMMHAAIGVMLAWIYMLAFEPFLPGPSTARGAIYGLVPFLIAQLALMPLMGMGVFSANLGQAASMMVLDSLMGHVVYGIVMAWVYGLNQS